MSDVSMISIFDKMTMYQLFEAYLLTSKINYCSELTEKSKILLGSMCLFPVL